VIKSFGLLSKTYCSFSFDNLLPLKTTLSKGEILVPTAVTILLFTVMAPETISLSASRLEQTPELAIYLFKRISSETVVFLICVCVSFFVFKISGFLFFLIIFIFCSSFFFF